MIDIYIYINIYIYNSIVVDFNQVEQICASQIWIISTRIGVNWLICLNHDLEFRRMFNQVTVKKHFELFSHRNLGLIKGQWLVIIPYFLGEVAVRVPLRFPWFSMWKMISLTPTVPPSTQSMGSPDIDPKSATLSPCKTRSAVRKQQHVHTWRIIPVSKWLVTPIYKPFRLFIRGINPYRELTITMVINHLRPSWDDPPSSNPQAPCIKVKLSSGPHMKNPTIKAIT